MKNIDSCDEERCKDRDRRYSREGFIDSAEVLPRRNCYDMAGGGEGVPSLSSGERHRGYGRDNGGGLRRTKAARMLRPYPRSDS